MKNISKIIKITKTKSTAQYSEKTYKWLLESLIISSLLWDSVCTPIMCFFFILSRMVNIGHTKMNILTLLNVFLPLVTLERTGLDVLKVQNTNTYLNMTRTSNLLWCNCNYLNHNFFVLIDKMGFFRSQFFPKREL